jgi:ATP-dependent RNA helicase DDX1
MKVIAVVFLLYLCSPQLSSLCFFPADKLVEADTLPTVLQCFNACPTFGKGEHRLQVCFFSATLHSDAIKDLTAKICKNPTWVDLKGKDAIPDSVHHVVYRVNLKQQSEKRKHDAITDGVHVGKAGSARERQSQELKEMKQHVLLEIVDKFNMSQCIIFCRTNVDCNNLETFLCSQDDSGSSAQNKKFRGIVESGKEIKYSCCVLAGMRSMDQRRESLAAFKEGNVRFLICTDVAARGIDISGLPYVINMTLPDEAEQYIHRIGRVGRAERMGLAISIVCPDGVDEKVWFHKCNNRGKDGCTRRQLTSEGGCTVWYNETQYFNNIQSRLDMAVPVLNDDFSLPDELASLGVEYGEVWQDPNANSGANFHLDLLHPAMHELVSMEHEAQNIFLMYQANEEFC